MLACKKDMGNGLGCVLFCDKLSMHVADEAKDVFHKGHVFCCFHPPQTVESTQPAGTRYCRSSHFSIGSLLGWQLLSDIIMEK